MAMKFRKLYALVLVLVLSISCPVSAYATELPKDEKGDRGITENIGNVEDSLVNQIKENNMHVERLWQNALAESITDVYRMGETPLENEIYPVADLKTASTKHYHWYGLYYVGILFKATFTTYTNSGGSEFVGSVRTISATGTSNNTLVSVDDYSYTLIDQGRTIATNFSCTIGTRRSEEDTYHYFSYDYYVEFRVTGEGHVY